jgi:hypothetical protein
MTETKIDYLIKELKEHIPFTALATVISIIAILLLLKINSISSLVPFFYVFHPAHILFSAMVSSAMFYNYKKNIFLSILTGLFISIIVGSISDVLFPYLGSLLFGIPISFHLPAIEVPALILGAGLVGATLGAIIKKTKFPHFVHVFISVFASLLYIFAYSTNFSLINLVLILVIASIAVVIPCCLGDIVLPMIFQNKIKISHEHKFSRKFKRKKPEVSS